MQAQPRSGRLAEPGVFLLVVVAAVYFAAGKVGLSFAAVNMSASAVWPPTGISIAAFLLFGRNVWPAILAGAFLVNLTTSGAILSSIGVAVGNTLEGLLAGYLAERYAHGRDCFRRAGDVFRFSLLSAASTTVAASIGAFSLGLGGQAEWSAFGAIWLTWWLGDTAGALVMAPAIVLCYLRPRLELTPRRRVEALLTFLAVLAVGAVCFAVPVVSKYPVAFLCLPPLAWLALRFGQREVALAILALSVIAVASTEQGLGPFVMGTRHESLLVLQAFVATIALMMLPIAALVEEVADAMTQRERAVLDERRARAEVEAATRSKDEFLAMLSHELRNPLQAIGNSTYLLEMRGGADPATARSLEVIKRQTENLTRMVNDLLDVARAIAGKIVVVRQSVDLEAAIRRCLELLASSGRLEHHQLEVRTEPLRVHADPTRLEQMLMNLLVNAIKFTPKGGAIRVIMLRDGNFAVVRIEDEGIGIPAELLPRIFDLFTQGKQRNPDRREGGLGIGLAMVRRLVELHGGRIDAHSDGPGRGSRFVLSLPLARQSADRASDMTRGRARRVLVIENAGAASGSIREALETEGHEVFHALDSRAGMEAALRVRPDAIVIDVASQADGYEVAKALRARTAEMGVRPQMVAITGYGAFEDTERARAAGFDEHLPKPLDRAALRRALA